MASSLCLWLLSVSLVFLAGLFTRLTPSRGPPNVNYDSSVYFDHTHLKTPSSKDDVIEIVKEAVDGGRKVRVVGSGHSWSSVAMSDDIIVSLWNYTGIISVNSRAMEVTVKAGTTLKQLNQYLDSRGLAMKNLGSISEQTVAGAISTGTHGNGLGYGNLATLVTRLEFVNGKGELVSTSANSHPKLFKAAQVSIGMLGMITEITFEIEPKYYLREVLSLRSFEDCSLNFEELMRGGDHAKMWIELFTGKCGLFVSNKTRETSPRDNPNWTVKNIEVYAMEAVLYLTSWFPFFIPHIMKLIFKPPTVFMPYDRVDVSYNVLQVPHALPTHWEAELSVPFEQCAAALDELRHIVLENSMPVNMPIEVRPVKSDDILLSPNYHRDSCHITLTLYKPSSDTTCSYFGNFFEATSQLNLAPRVHWGKYTCGVGSHEVKLMYPRLSDFARIREEMDPHSVFMSHALREMFNF